MTVRESAGRLVIEVTEPELAPAAKVLETIARVVDGGLPERDADTLVRCPKRRQTD